MSTSSILNDVSSPNWMGVQDQYAEVVVWDYPIISPLRDKVSIFYYFLSSGCNWSVIVQYTEKINII